MNPPPNREVTLFSAALELPADQRSAYLLGACADDPALRLRIEALLRVHEEAVPFLENPQPGALAEKAGDRIGHYKLLQQIGEGGCGVVYMAEQEEPVRRRVALKVIKLGMDTRQVIARFEAERQALAMMDHPNIAKIYDAGVTGVPLAPSLSAADGSGGRSEHLTAGRPFFVMELVRGTKITDYCDQNNLSTEERLKLFTQVCQAIQHAHQKGIIHRDIKPSNILVTVSEPGAPGCPKVIDFGIAKATTGQRLTDKTVFTAFEQFVGTPAYMSPEQATMTALEVDTRTDIYALGVLLYELLTGKTPLDQKDLLAAGLEEMRRTIREKEPIRPSTRLSTMLEGELTTAAKHRHTDAPKLIHLVRGDLDWIVMKALEKERARRYETANGLAMDVQRHLADEPVVARPPSKLYRFQKLARRNKVAFAATGAVAAALIIGLAVSTREYLKERSTRQRAEAAENEMVTINKFLTEDLLFQGTPEQNARDNNVTLVEVLERATRRLDTNAEIARQPKVEATLRLDFGTTFLKLSKLAEAGHNLSNAFNLRRAALGPLHLDTLAAEHKLMEFLLLGAGKFEEAEPLVLETYEAEKRLLGPTNRATLDSEQGYEIILDETGRLPEAERLARKNLQSCEKALGPDDSLTMDALRNLSGIESQLGDYAEAERLNHLVLVRSQRTGHREQELFSVNQIALYRLLQGDPQGADKLLAAAMPPAVQRFGPDDTTVLWTERIWARALADEGELAKAESLAESALAAKRLTPDTVGTCRTLLILGRVLVEQGRIDRAELLLTEALTFFREHAVGRRDALAAQTANWLGAIQVARNAYPEAEKLLLSDSDQFFSLAAVMSPHERRLAVGHILSLYQALGNSEQTAIWQKKLDALANPRPKNVN